MSKALKRLGQGKIKPMKVPLQTSLWKPKPGQKANGKLRISSKLAKARRRINKKSAL